MDLMEARRQSHKLRKSGLHDVVIQNGGTRFDDPADVARTEIDLDAVLAQNTALSTKREAAPFPSKDSPDMLSDLSTRANDREEAVAENQQQLASVGRAVAGGVQDFGLTTVSLAEDISEFADGTTLGKGLGFIIPGLRNFNYAREQTPDGMRMEDAIEQGLESIGLRIPEGDGTVESLARGLVQFGAGMLAAPVKGVGYLKMMLRGGFADALFDPEDGNISTLLRELGLDNAVLEYMDSAVDEDADAAERLKARLTNSFEGGIAGGIIDIAVTGLRIAKSNEGFRNLIREKLTGMGKRADDRIAARDDKNTLNSGMDPTLITDPIIAAVGRKASIGKDERGFISASAPNPESAKEAVAVVQEIKNNFPTSEGWTPIKVGSNEKSPSYTIDNEGNIKIKWQQPPYEFNKPKNPKVSPENHKRKMVDTMVGDVSDLVKRAQDGDQAAVNIIEEANWYRSMRTRLRKEFGGLGDVFADILGATSAQTNVQQNYTNSLEVLRRFSRGEFDGQIKAYEKHLAKGGKKGPAIFERDKDASDEFSLIRNAAGQMFGANSPAATDALLNMFRQIKPGKSPKTINFTGNLIGYGSDATIDVWAARYLRKASGRGRIPPAAEPGVSGKHLTKSTMESPRIGQEFGFGQEVFSEASSIINNTGVIKSFDPGLGDMGPDDLQAVVWFMEKELWSQNGWTSKVGEGGSFDYESKFGGSPDRGRAAELRSIINKQDSTPEDIVAAQSELGTLEGEAQRYVAGVSRERPGQVPTNVDQAELASELTAPLASDASVIGFQANNTVGEFVGETERALNFEMVTQTNFDPTNVKRALIEAGRKYDQDAVFLSKVVDGNSETARPGVEVYFKERQGVDYAQQVTAILRERGIDGFTFVTDARQSDRFDVQASNDESTAGLVGLRFQYIPEFDDAFDVANSAQIFADKGDQFHDVMLDIAKIDGITYADVVHYETEVFKNTDRSGTEWINGGTGYGEYLGSSTATKISDGGNRR